MTQTKRKQQQKTTTKKSEKPQQQEKKTNPSLSVISSLNHFWQCQKQVSVSRIVSAYSVSAGALQVLWGKASCDEVRSMHPELWLHLTVQAPQCTWQNDVTATKEPAKLSNRQPSRCLQWQNLVSHMQKWGDLLSPPLCLLGLRLIVLRVQCWQVVFLIFPILHIGRETASSQVSLLPLAASFQVSLKSGEWLCKSSTGKSLPNSSQNQDSCLLAMNLRSLCAVIERDSPGCCTFWLHIHTNFFPFSSSLLMRVLSWNYPFCYKV